MMDNGGGVPGVSAKVLLDFHRYNHLMECSKRQKLGDGAPSGEEAAMTNQVEQPPQQSGGYDDYAAEADGGGDDGGAAIANARYRRDILDQDQDRMKELEMERERERRHGPAYAPSIRGGHGSRGQRGGVGPARTKPKPKLAATGAWYKLKR